MKSFPSSFNRGGNSQQFVGKHETITEINNDQDASQLDKIRAKNINYTTAVKKYLFNQTDTTKFNHYVNFNKETQYDESKKKPENKATFENPQFIPSWILRSMNNYRAVFKNQLKNKLSAVKDGDTMKVSIAYTDVSPALFNPQFMVQAVGMTQNVPLLTNFRPSGKDQEHLKDIGDCRIEKLIQDSVHAQSPLGMARYRLVDFMYCKDLGKVSNNHLITLRKFPFPIGDHIFQFSGPKYISEFHSCDTPGDVGRLLTWFGTDDNKLEDICKFETQATWKEIENKVQEIDSKEDNPERGMVATIMNTVNPMYNKNADYTGNGGNTILAALGASLWPNLRKDSTDNNDVLRMSADNNKIYTDLNSVQDNHIYEGRLILNQEMTINFSYKLRAYENINPKSAFLDLMGNILEVTYQRGHYFAGKRVMIGPPQNVAGWRKANALIDNAWSKLGGFIESLGAGTMNFGDILGAVSNMIGDSVRNAVDSIKDIDTSNLGQDLVNKLIEVNKATGISYELKALLKNQLGRPALYAMDSLISGDDVGCWHLTIGNPYNPIMTIGNLILTSSTVTHSGALGVDDFPSEIKVTCTLKPARSRDTTEIARYYTKGMNSIYMTTSGNNSSDFYNFGGGFESSNYDKLRATAQEKNMKTDIKFGGQSSVKEPSNDSSLPQNNSGNQELSPSKDQFLKDLREFNTINNEVIPEGWEGLNSESKTKIFSLNNWSMLQWNMGNDEIS